MKVTDEEIEAFKNKWALECAEWAQIRDEVIAKDGECSAYQVTAEQARRMRERGETSVLVGPVAKALGLSPHVVLYPVADPPELKIDRLVRAFLRGRSVAELKAIRDACDEAIGSGNCWRLGCREPVDPGKAECALHPLADVDDGPPGPPAAGCFVPGCTGPCDGEPDRADPPVADEPIRCQILVGISRWRCLSPGCDDKGTILRDRLYSPHGEVSIARPAPPVCQGGGKRCVFDEARKP